MIMAGKVGKDNRPNNQPTGACITGTARWKGKDVNDNATQDGIKGMGGEIGC